MPSLVALPNIYCTPADVYDYLSVEGTQLRLDDHNLATGQIIQATVDALAGATTISITALSNPLIAGTTLTFDGGGMPAALDVVLATTAAAGATTLTVVQLSATVKSMAQARDSGVNTALAQRLVKATQYATAQVKMYCTPRYNDSALCQSWSVNRWATVLAGRWMSRRRAQGCPKAIEQDALEVMEEMKGVRFGRLTIEDVGTRTAGWPFLTNVTVDIRFDTAKIRVEQPISEGTPTQYSQFIDWNSALFIEYW